MDNYIENNLTKDEKVIIRAKLNYLVYVPAIILTVISIIILFVGIKLIKKYASTNTITETTTDIMLLVICFALILMIIIATTPFGLKLAVTNKRVLGKKGIFSLSAVDYPINKIDQIRISAGFFGKIFNYSCLIIKGTSDSGRGGLKFYGISNAIELKNCINDALDAYAEEARKSQAEEIANAMTHQD